MRLVPSCTAGSPSPSSDGESARLFDVEPLPRRPELARPQHFTAKMSSTAQVCWLPANTARAERPVPRLTTGRVSPSVSAVSPILLCVPIPSRPAEPAPQHFVVSLTSSAHVCAPPALTDLARFSSPRSTEVSDSPSSLVVRPTSISLPMPRRPLDPTPQHTMLSSSRIAHVCAAPAVTERALRPVPRLTAMSESPISPLSSPTEYSLPVPRRPFAPRPQHTIESSSRSAHV